jgi:hypothetical protein
MGWPGNTAGALNSFMAVHMTYHQSAMPEPVNPLPTLREKLASFDGAIGADDIARLRQTSRHTIYLW